MPHKGFTVIAMIIQLHTDFLGLALTLFLSHYIVID